MQDKLNEAYAAWRLDPTPDKMTEVVRILRPLLLSEINRYPGDNHLLRGQAKKLAVGAVQTYNPDSGARLSSWVVTQLQPLSRYGRKSKQIVNVPEMAYRQFAEVDSHRKEFLDEEGREPTDEELADMSGISVKRIREVRQMNPVVASTGTLDSGSTSEDDSNVAPPVLDVGADPGLATALEAIYEGADERDRAILDMKTGRGGREILSNQDIATRLGVSPGLISQRSLELANAMQEAYGI